MTAVNTWMTDWTEKWPHSLIHQHLLIQCVPVCVFDACLLKCSVYVCVCVYACASVCHSVSSFRPSWGGCVGLPHTGKTLSCLILSMHCHIKHGLLNALHMNFINEQTRKCMNNAYICIFVLYILSSCPANLRQPHSLFSVQISTANSSELPNHKPGNKSGSDVYLVENVHIKKRRRVGRWGCRINPVTFYFSVPGESASPCIFHPSCYFYLKKALLNYW